MMYLIDDELGRLDLDCGTGFVVSSFEVSFPAERAVVRNRALTDGVQDDTTYLGARVVTVGLRLDSSVMPTQALLDMVMPFVSPRRRPLLVYKVQQPRQYECDPVDDPSYVRTFRLRGVDAPLVVDAPKYTSIGLQWVTTDAYALALDETCAVANTTGVEFGRDYDLTFDRSYPPSPPFGVTQFQVGGNAPTDWTGTVTAEVEDPQLLVNDVTIEFTGLTLTAGQTINIDTKARTILRNNDPTDSVFGFTNFADWTWDQLRFDAGLNQIRMEGDNAVGDPSFTVCWRDAWF